MFLLTKLLDIALIVESRLIIEYEVILNCSSILLIYDLSFFMVLICFLVWLIPLMVSLYNLSCIYFYIIYVAVESCIFDFATFIGIMKSKPWLDCFSS